MCPCPHTHWNLTEKKKVIQANIIKHSEFYGRKIVSAMETQSKRTSSHQGFGEAPTKVRKTVLLKELAN